MIHNPIATACGDANFRECRRDSCRARKTFVSRLTGDSLHRGSTPFLIPLQIRKKYDVDEKACGEQWPLR